MTVSKLHMLCSLDSTHLVLDLHVHVLGSNLALARPLFSILERNAILRSLLQGGERPDHEQAMAPERARYM